MKRIALFLAVVLLVALLSGCDLLAKLLKSAGEDVDKPNTGKPTQTDNKGVLKYTYEYIKAEYSDGKLVLRFNSKEAPSYIFDDSGVSPKDPLEISGFDDVYKDMMIGTIGQDLNPIVFMLTKAGKVEYYEIHKGITTGSFEKGGEIPPDEIGETESLEEGLAEDNGGGYITVFAIDKDEFRHDLSPYFDIRNRGLREISIFTRDVDNITDPSGTLTSRYELTLWSDNSMMFTEKVLTLGNYMYYLGSFDVVEGDFESEVLCEYNVKGTYPGSGQKPQEYKGSFRIKAESDGSYSITAVSGILLCEESLGTPAKFIDRSDICLFAGEWKMEEEFEGIVWVYAITITEDWEIVYGLGPVLSEWVDVFEGTLTPISQSGTGAECAFEMTEMFEDDKNAEGVLNLMYIDGNPERLELIVNSGYRLTPDEYGEAAEFNPYPHYEYEE
ncbi:MAG: hypothetical protein GX928_06940 [Ruminococcaceae bacterium]|nr:hypothetical protein [Oscillospiraceae bacterium]